MKLFQSFINGLASSSDSVAPPTILPYLAEFRYGADYAISSNSDQWTNDANHAQMEFYSWKYGIRSTIFEASRTSPISRGQYTQDIFESSIYFYTDKYHNGTSYVSIPDYYASNWTSSGVAAFPQAVLGASKPTRYPNIGTQQYYMSNGKVGVQLNVPWTDWDKGLVLGINPSSDPDETKGAVIIATGTDSDGFYPSLLNTSIHGNIGSSYRNGQEGTRQLYQKYFIGTRNSSSSLMSNNEWFDSYKINNRADNSYPSTFRVMDVWMDEEGTTIPDKIDYLEGRLEDSTIPNGGWFHNFTHFWSANMTDMESFYGRLKTVRDRNSQTCWNAGMSEAVEYLWYKDMVTSVKLDNGDTVSVTIDNRYNLDLNRIDTPISVHVDLSNSYLSGKNITSDYGRVRSLGQNKFVVEVPISSLTTTLSETQTPDYMAFAYPVVTNYVLDGTTLTVTTDKSTRCTLFNNSAGNVHTRTYDDSKTHVFTGVSSGTYYLGAMTREKRTIIETITV